MSDISLSLGRVSNVDSAYERSLLGCPWTLPPYTCARDFGALDDTLTVPFPNYVLSL